MKFDPKLNGPDSRDHFEREIKLACHFLTLVNLGPENYTVDDARPHTIDCGWFTIKHIMKFDHLLDVLGQVQAPSQEIALCLGWIAFLSKPISIIRVSSETIIFLFL